MDSEIGRLLVELGLAARRADGSLDYQPDKTNTVVVVMGDNGTLYGIFNKETAQSMTRLCEKADILTPNMTEAYCLLHEPFKDGPYDEKELKRVMKALSDFGPKIVILTGAYTDEETIGVE